MRRLIAGLVLAVIVAAAAGGLWYRQWLAEPLRLPSDPYVLVVPPGGSLSGVSRSLAAEGVVAHPALLVAVGRLAGDAAHIRAGEYQLEQGVTPRELVRRLREGRVLLHSLTLVEGWTVRQILAAIRREPTLRPTLAAEDAEALARELGFDEPSAEGLFLPETYRFPRDTTDRELLGWARRAMDEALAAAWAARDPSIPLASPYELLTLASIVDRETGLAAERPRIAGVFVRRLELGMPLQTDPTVIYGLGTAFDGNLTRAHLMTDTPWNTYTRGGLPPTPIAAPGRDALQATARPAPGNELYFVASGAGDGSHRFSATLAEHNRAVAAYLEALRRRAR